MKSSIVQSDKSGLCQIHQKVQHIEDMAVQQRGQTNEILMLSSVKFSNTTWLSGKVM